MLLTSTEKQRGYHDATHELIERMCRNVEREDFELDKERAQECILKTYDLFNLPRPKKVHWCVDIFNKKYQEALTSSWSAGSAGSARSAGSALDYDFDWYVYEHEYCQENTDQNKNDLLYLAYCALLMQAKEYGAGYRVEYEDTLYIAPTPLVKINADNQFHSIESPAIHWKDASEFHYLYGVNFEKPLWESVVQKTLKFPDILTMQNMEQRMAALRHYGPEELLNSSKALLINTSTRGNALYVIAKDVGIFPQDEYFLKYACPSTGRVYVKSISPEAGKTHDPDFCQASTFVYPMTKEDGVVEIRPLTKEEYASVSLES